MFAPVGAAPSAMSSRSLFESVVQEPLWQLLRCDARADVTQCARRLCDAVFTAVQQILTHPPDRRGGLGQGDVRDANSSAARAMLRAHLLFLSRVNTALLQPDAYLHTHTRVMARRHTDDTMEEDEQGQQPRRKRRTESDGGGGGGSIVDAERAAAELETVFIQFATTVHMYLLSCEYIACENDTTADTYSPSSVATVNATEGVLPSVVQYALRGCAEGVMALSFVLERPDMMSGSSRTRLAKRRRVVAAEVHRLWYAGQFIFLQQLAARGGANAAGYSAFFAECAARAQKMKEELDASSRPRPVISGAFTDSESDETSLDGTDDTVHSDHENNNNNNNSSSSSKSLGNLAAPLSSISSSNTSDEDDENAGNVHGKPSPLCREDEQSSSAPATAASFIPVTLDALGAAQVAQLRHDACAAWGCVTASLMADTIARSRFRRAAVRFKSFVPHMITQAPIATFALYDVLHRFVRDWEAKMQTVLLGQLSCYGSRLSGILDDDSKDKGSSVEAHTDIGDDAASSSGHMCDSDDDAQVNSEMAGQYAAGRQVRKEMLELIDGYADQVVSVIGESAMHGALVATVLGAVLCAIYILPHSRSKNTTHTSTPSNYSTTVRTDNDNNIKADSNSMHSSSSAQASASESAYSASTTVALSRRPTISTVLRANTSNSSVSTSQTMHRNKASISGLVPMGAVHAPDVSRSVSSTVASSSQSVTTAAIATEIMSLSDSTASDIGQVELLESTSWLYHPHSCSEAEWQLRQFAPLGVLLRRSGATCVELLRDHLCCFASQLCIGFSHAHRVEGRRKFAQCALLTGLCDSRVAWVIYHFASDANASMSVFNVHGIANSSSSGTNRAASSSGVASAGSVALPSVTLAAFTRAVERYTAGAESELVLNVSATTPSSPPPPSFDQSVSSMMHNANCNIYNMNMNSSNHNPIMSLPPPAPPPGVNGSVGCNNNNNNSNCRNNMNMSVNNNTNIPFRGGVGMSRELHSSGRVANSAAESREAVHHGCGEVTGERFCRMVFPHPLPVWDSFVNAVATVVAHLAPASTTSTPAAAAATSSSSLAPASYSGTLDSSSTTATASTTAKHAMSASPPTSSSTTASSSTATANTMAAAVAPCRFVLELLIAGYHGAAVQAMQCLMVYDHANVLLTPRRSIDGAYGVSVAVYVRAILMRWLLRWRERDEQRSRDEYSSPDTQGGPCPIDTQDGSKADSDGSMFAEVSSLSEAARTHSAETGHDDASRCRGGGHASRDAHEDATDSEVEEVMHALLPLLSWVNTHAASQTILSALLNRLYRWCWRSAQRSGAALAAFACSSRQSALRRRFALTELVLVRFVMPCMRVLPPSHVVYDSMQGIFRVWRKWGCGFGASEVGVLHMRLWCDYLLDKPVLARRDSHDVTLGRHKSGLATGKYVDHGSNAINDTVEDSVLVQERAALCHSLRAHGLRAPHDVVRRKELHALLLQSFKRVNAARVGQYRDLLRHVIFADPLFVFERLLVQAVGYENSFLHVHTQLLLGLPAALLTLLMQYGLHVLEYYAATAEDRTETLVAGSATSAAAAAGARQSRIALVATFLVTVWRENVEHALEEGAVLVHAVECMLRRYSRANLLVATELLKALLFHFAHGKLEHEERFSPAQMRSLAAVHPMTRFFARGSMESFRVTRWTAKSTMNGHSGSCRGSGNDHLTSDHSMTPCALMRARRALVAVLYTMHSTPHTHHSDDVSQHEEEEEEEEDDTRRAAASWRRVTLPLGHHIVLHLSRLHAQIHRLQADLEGTMEFVMLTSAKDYNVLNDCVFALMELMGSGPPAKLLVPVAMPQLSLCLTHRFRSLRCMSGRAAWQWYASDGTSDASSSLSLSPTGASELDAAASLPDKAAAAIVCVLPLWYIQFLSTLRISHLEYSSEPYEMALAELQHCRARATQNGALATCRWLDAQQRAIESAQATAEEVFMREHAQKRARLRRWTYRTVLMLASSHDACGNEDGDGDSSKQCETVKDHKEVSTSHHPRRDDNRRDAENAGDDRRLALAASYLLPRALLSHEDALFVCAFLRWLLRSTRSAAGGHRAALDVAFYLVTAAATFFVGLTDGECYRLGYVLHDVVAVVQQSCDEHTNCPGGSGGSSSSSSSSADEHRGRCHHNPAAGSSDHGETEASGSTGDGQRAAEEQVGTEDGCAGDVATGAGANDAGAAVSRKSNTSVESAAADQWMRVRDACVRHPYARRFTHTHGGERAMMAAAAAAAAEDEQKEEDKSGEVSHRAHSVSLRANGAARRRRPGRVCPSGLPAAPLQLEAYLCQWVRQVLGGGDSRVTGQTSEAPPHIHRNMLAVLRLLLATEDASPGDKNAQVHRAVNDAPAEVEGNPRDGHASGGSSHNSPNNANSSHVPLFTHTPRATAAVESAHTLPVYRGFPRTRVGCTAMLRAVAPHADDKLPSYAAAIGVLKLLRQRVRAMTVTHDTLTRVAHAHRCKRKRCSSSSSASDTEEDDNIYGSRKSSSSSNNNTMDATNASVANEDDVEMSKWGGVSAVLAWLRRDRLCEHFVQHALRADDSGVQAGEEDHTPAAQALVSAQNEKDDSEVLLPMSNEEDSDMNGEVDDGNAAQGEAKDTPVVCDMEERAEVSIESMGTEKVESRAVHGLSDSPAVSPIRSLSPLSSSSLSSSASSSPCSLLSTNETAVTTTAVPSGQTTQSMEALTLGESFAAPLIGTEDARSVPSAHAGLVDVHMDHVGAEAHTLSPISDEDDDGGGGDQCEEDG